MSNPLKIAVIGAGSWGTALAILLSQKFSNVQLWAHRKAHSDELIKERENSKYLPTISFPPDLKITNNLQTAVTDANIVVMVVPSHSYRDVFGKLLAYLHPGCLFG